MKKYIYIFVLVLLPLANVAQQLGTIDSIWVRPINTGFVEIEVQTTAPGASYKGSYVVMTNDSIRLNLCYGLDFVTGGLPITLKRRVYIPIENNHNFTVVIKDYRYFSDVGDLCLNDESLVFASYIFSFSTPLTTEIAIGVPLSIDENKEYGVNIYPNPANEYIHLDIPDDIVVQKVEILDMQGKLFYRYIAQNIHEIAPLELPSGIYFVRLYTDKSLLTRKLIINKN